MITLYKVKVNNTYTYINAGVPTVAEKEPVYTTGQTWLDSDTGFSYQLIDQVAGTWVQIELTEDTKILSQINPKFNEMVMYLQNPFVLDRNTAYNDADKDYNQTLPSQFTREEANSLYFSECVYSEFTFDAAGKTITASVDIWGAFASFEIGDTVLIVGSLRNRGYFTVAARTDSVLTVDEELINSVSNCFICLAQIPEGFIDIVARMIWFDVFVRPNLGTGIKSERIGTYSYTLQEMTNGISYPDDIVNSLSVYEGMALGGTSVYVS